jgi:hypothetical protein
MQNLNILLEEEVLVQSSIKLMTILQLHHEATASHLAEEIVEFLKNTVGGVMMIESVVVTNI